MRALLEALIVWSVAVAAWALLYPWPGETLGCLRLVSRPLVCEVQQEAISAALWAHYTLPIIIGIASGYVGIVIVWLTGARRTRTGALR